MSAEQVVRDFLSTYETGGVEPSIRYLADNMTLTAVTPPIQGGKNEFIDQGRLIKEAMPDFRWGVQSMNTQGNQVTLTLHPSGTQTGTLHLGAFVPGAPDIPPTGKKVGAPDKLVFMVTGDKISAVTFDSPPNGGLVALLGQLGVQLPPM